MPAAACNDGNIDASNTGEKSQLGMEYVNDTEFHILNGGQYFYDLTGRRIENRANAGIYIIDGKKVLVR